MSSSCRRRRRSSCRSSCRSSSSPPPRPSPRILPSPPPPTVRARRARRWRRIPARRRGPDVPVEPSDGLRGRLRDRPLLRSGCRRRVFGIGRGDASRTLSARRASQGRRRVDPASDPSSRRGSRSSSPSRFARAVRPPRVPEPPSRPASRRRVRRGSSTSRDDASLRGDGVASTRSNASSPWRGAVAVAEVDADDGDMMARVAAATAAAIAAGLRAEGEAEAEAGDVVCGFAANGSAAAGSHPTGRRPSRPPLRAVFALVRRDKPPPPPREGSSLPLARLALRLARLARLARLSDAARPSRRLGRTRRWRRRRIPDRTARGPLRRGARRCDRRARLSPPPTPPPRVACPRARDAPPPSPPPRARAAAATVSSARIDARRRSAASSAARNSCRFARSDAVAASSVFFVRRERSDAAFASADVARSRSEANVSADHSFAFVSFVSDRLSLASSFFAASPSSISLTGANGGDVRLRVRFHRRASRGELRALRLVQNFPRARAASRGGEFGEFARRVSRLRGDTR